jgi:ACS family glucarate transporter-like MFS transporter
MKGIRWIVLAILVLGSAIAYVLRTNFNVVSETAMHDLGMNEYQLGMVFSAFAAGYAIFQFPGGIFGDKYGPRFTITLIAVAWAVLTLVTAAIPGNGVLSVATIVVALIVTRFLVGAFHAPFFPVTIGGTIASWFPLRQWGLSNGLTSTGLTLGAAATAPIIVWFMDAYGWRSAMLVTAPVGLVFAILFRWYITDEPKDHPHITNEELDLIASDRPTAGHVPSKGAWKVALLNRNVLLITSSYFCMNYLFYLFFSWFFFYLTDIKGLSNTDAGMFVSAQWVLGAIGATAGGISCDLLVRRFGIRNGPRYLTMTALLLSAVFLFLGATYADPVFSIVFLCLSFACNQLSEAPIWVATMAVSGRHAAVATGILNTGANLPGVLGGLLVPITAGLFGWPAAMATGSVFAIIGALLWIFIRADEPMSD